MAYTPTANSGFMDQKNRSFEQVVDPLVADFVQKVLHNVLSEYTGQLQPVQIEYIVNKIRQQLEALRYDAKSDLGNVINNLWRQGNRAAAAVQTPKEQPADTPLTSAISQLFNRKR